MQITNYISTFRNTILPSILNSYSMIFFFNNRLLSVVIMLVSFFNFYAGLSGLIAVVVSVMISNSMGFDKNLLKTGLYSFNALLTGIGMGTFFDPGYVFFSLLLLAALLTLILSVTLSGWFGKYGLPFLSIPFVFTFWFIVLPSSMFENLGLTQRNVFWINEVYALGGDSMLNFFTTVDAIPLHKMVDIYLRSMSSIFFQDNLITGALLAITLLICSRIAFSLSIIGFVSAYFFAKFSGSAAASITYYNIGANYIMAAIALGGFFIIPSRISYLWTILLVPLTSLVLLFMTKFFGNMQLPVFSLPFSFVVIFFVYFLRLRTNPSKLKMTPYQYYSPEINLYTFNNNQERLSNLIYFPLYLPFWGEWTITQGHDGDYTHKGEWGKAFDFELSDDEAKNFKSDGLLCEDYLCYNKPVLAPADGIVEDIFDNFDDNEIGRVNTTNNWGNTIIIKHLPGVYTQMSHLKKGSFKVAKGNFVKRGDLLANCGNSGRSPRPHLHFQVQSTPALGSKTLEYPFAYFNEKKDNELVLKQYSKPTEGSLISGISSMPILKSAFELLPNSVLNFSYVNEMGIEKTEKWEAYTDAYNSKYLYCKETGATAFYVNDDSMFYFTSFYGNKESLLYYFYLTAYRVFLGDDSKIEIHDVMPLSIIPNRKISFWLHDFIAPFYSYIKVLHSIKTESGIKSFDAESLVLKSTVQISVFGKKRIFSKSQIELKEQCIKEFSFESKKTKIRATCIK
jgi:urea transporter